MTLASILTWWDAHAASLALVLAALTTLARVLWTAVGPRVRARSPRVHAAVETLGALSPDVWRAVSVVLRAHAAARSAPPPAAPPGRSGESGCATAPALALAGFVGLLALGFVGLALQGCPRAREAVLDTQSPRVACAADTQRCHDGAPEVCSRAGRWWPAMPPQDDGTRRRCADVCEVSPDGIAHCASSQVVSP